MQKNDELWELISIYRELISHREFAKENMGEWVEPIDYQPIYVLASNYQIAKSIFDIYFGFTKLSRRIDFRYIDRVEKIYGIRNQYIVVSSERYQNGSFYDRLGWIREQSPIREFEVVYEQDLEKEQVREKVSRQRPQGTKSK